MLMAYRRIGMDTEEGLSELESNKIGKSLLELEFEDSVELDTPLILILWKVNNPH